MGVLFEKFRASGSGLGDEFQWGDLGVMTISSSSKPVSNPSQSEEKVSPESFYQRLPSFLKPYAKPFVTPEVYQKKVRHISPLQADRLSKEITYLPPDASETSLVHRFQGVWDQERNTFYSIHFYLPEGALTEVQQQSLFSLAAGLNLYAHNSMQDVFWDADTVNIGSEQHPDYSPHYWEGTIHLSSSFESAELDYFSSTQSTYVHEFMHHLFNDREIFKDTDWTETIYPLCLGGQNYELLQDANYLRGTSNEKGHPWDNANEAFASGASAFYFSADQLVTFILHPETSPEMAEFGKLVWCYLRDRVFGRVFTQDGLDPFVGESLDDLLAQAEDKKLNSLLRGMQDPISHQMASYHLLGDPLVSFREIPMLFRRASREEKKAILENLYAAIAIVCDQESRLPVQGAFIRRNADVSPSHVVSTPLKLIAQTAIAAALNDGDAEVRWLGLSGLAILHPAPLEMVQAILPLVKAENRELAQQARNFLSEVIYTSGFRQRGEIFDALADLAHHGTLDNSLWALSLLKDCSHLWDSDLLMGHMLEFAETHPEIEVRRESFSYLIEKLAGGPPQQLALKEEIEDLCWQVWNGETDVLLRLQAMKGIYALEAHKDFSQEFLGALESELLNSDPEVFLGSAKLLLEMQFPQPSIETDLLVESMMPRLRYLAEEHPQFEIKTGASMLIIQRDSNS